MGAASVVSSPGDPIETKRLVPETVSTASRSPPRGSRNVSPTFPRPSGRPGSSSRREVRLSTEIQRIEREFFPGKDARAENRGGVMKKPSNRPRSRPIRPSFLILERRALLTGDPSGVWLGQDGHDLVGPSSNPAPDGVQDIHVAVSGLPAGETIVFAEIQGFGGGDWQYRGPYGPWAAAVVQTAGATNADLYFEPSQVETGRPFQITLKYADGTASNFWIQGGKADPNLRMPQASLQATWLGQDGRDLTGPTPAVGPDGYQDVHLALSGLSADLPIVSATLDGPNGQSWSFGLNHEGNANAELVRNPADPSKADLYFSPLVNLNGQPLSLTVVYSTNQTDHTTLTGGSDNPTLAMPSPSSISIDWNAIQASWAGQDPAPPGLARVNVSGIPAGRSIVAAALVDGVAGSWSYQAAGVSNFYADPAAAPLAVQSTSPTTSVLAFAPERSEAGATLTLRILLDDGSTLATRFAGASADPGLTAPRPNSNSIVADPSSNLQSLVDTYGTVRLSSGTYALSQPLILNHPVTIVGDPGATLMFNQASGSAPWSAAIKINAGHTTLEGFAVRFASPVVWASNVNDGPAVIGTTDNLDPGPNLPKPDLLLQNLDVQSPPVPSGSWVEAPRLLRLTTATSGTIEGNILKGGTTEFRGGPWTIVGNDYQGTVPNTYSYAAFAGHQTHDLILQKNSASPIGPSGKTWRFLVLTDSGEGDLIDSNSVVGIGPQNSDTVQANASEIVLTEAYRLHFEGVPAALSADGLILQIPNPQGGAARPGDVVAILSGPDAGRYVTIAQPLSPTAYLLQSPLPQGTYAVSISTGFVNETYSRNVIDARGSTIAADLVLIGNQFGTRIVNNTLEGGGQALLLRATPTESPVQWGWSHSPAFGIVATGNTLVDSTQGAAIDVQHGSAIKSDQGRVYLTANFSNNVIEWSSAFLASQTQGGGKEPGTIAIGDNGSIDAGDLVLQSSGNALLVPTGYAPKGAIRVIAATVNGQKTADGTLPLPTVPPPAPSNLHLIHDTGASATDGVTNNPALAFNPADRAVGYEYALNGSSTFLPIGNSTMFVPSGLVAGTDTVALRAFDASGRRGDAATFSFVYIPNPPAPSVPVLATPGAIDVPGAGELTNSIAPTLAVVGTGLDVLVLYRDGMAVATRVGSGTLVDPTHPADGLHQYRVLETDLAGNTGMSPPLGVTIDTRTPPPPTRLRRIDQNRLTFDPVPGASFYEYALSAEGPFASIGNATTFVPAGIRPGGSVFVRAVDALGNLGLLALIVYPSANVSPAPNPAPSNGPITAPQPRPQSDPSGVWLGQDGRDLVGPWSVTVPDGTQDIHIVLRGLRPDQAIAYLEVDGLGGGQWIYNGPWGPFRAALVRRPGSTTADLYIQPYQVETGRPFAIMLRYADGQNVGFWVQGGSAVPGLADPHLFHIQRWIGRPHPEGRLALRLARETKARRFEVRHALDRLAGRHPQAEHQAHALLRPRRLPRPPFHGRRA